MKTYYTWEYIPVKQELEQEVWRTLHTVILKTTNDLAIEVGPQKTSNSLPKCIITSPTTIVGLQSLDTFRIRDVINMDNNIHLVGHLGMYEVYRDILAIDNGIIVNAYGKTGKIAVKGL